MYKCIHTRPDPRTSYFSGPEPRIFFLGLVRKIMSSKKIFEPKKNITTTKKKHTFFFAAARAATLAATRCVQLIVFHVDLLQGGHWSKDARVDQMNN